MTYNKLIEAAAYRFNVARDDLSYLIAHDGRPGVTEMLAAGDDYYYFGSLAEHECHLERLVEVKDKEGLIDACVRLRDCGYHDPSVVSMVGTAAHVVGDHNLIDARIMQLNNVQNTTDALKPISTAMAAALATKQKTIPKFVTQVAAQDAVTAGTVLDGDLLIVTG